MPYPRRLQQLPQQPIGGGGSMTSHHQTILSQMLIESQRRIEASKNRLKELESDLTKARARNDNLRALRVDEEKEKSPVVVKNNGGEAKKSMIVTYHPPPSKNGALPQQQLPPVSDLKKFSPAQLAEEMGAATPSFSAASIPRIKVQARNHYTQQLYPVASPSREEEKGDALSWQQIEPTEESPIMQSSNKYSPHRSTSGTDHHPHSLTSTPREKLLPELNPRGGRLKGSEMAAYSAPSKLGVSSSSMERYGLEAKEHAHHRSGAPPPAFKLPGESPPPTKQGEFLDDDQKKHNTTNAEISESTFQQPICDIDESTNPSSLQGEAATKSTKKNKSTEGDKDDAKALSSKKANPIGSSSLSAVAAGLSTSTSAAHREDDETMKNNVSKSAPCAQVGVLPRSGEDAFTKVFDSMKREHSGFGDSDAIKCRNTYTFVYMNSAGSVFECLFKTLSTRPEWKRYFIDTSTASVGPGAAKKGGGKSKSSITTVANPCCNRLENVNLFLGDKSTAEFLIEEARVIGMRSRRTSAWTSPLLLTPTCAHRQYKNNALPTTTGLTIMNYFEGTKDLTLKARMVRTLRNYFSTKKELNTIIPESFILHPREELADERDLLYRTALATTKQVEAGTWPGDSVPLSSGGASPMNYFLTAASNPTRMMIQSTKGQSRSSLYNYTPPPSNSSSNNTNASSSSLCRKKSNASPLVLPRTSSTVSPHQRYLDCLWIAKTSHGCHGENITLYPGTSEGMQDLFFNVDSQKEPHPWMVSKYLSRPLLLNGRKFDIRVWVLLMSPYEIYMHKRGVMRTSSEDYETSRNVLAHVTNHCLQAKSSKYSTHEEGNELWFEDLDALVRRSSGELGFTLEKDILPQMKHIIVATLLATKSRTKDEENYGSSVRCFQFFGYDFMIDENFKVWLLEVNGAPGIASQLNQCMVDDMIELVIDPIFPPSSSSSSSSKNKSKKEQQAQQEADAPLSSPRSNEEGMGTPRSSADEANSPLKVQVQLPTVSSKNAKKQKAFKRENEFELLYSYTEQRFK